MVGAVDSMDIISKIAKFDEEHAKIAMFKVFRQYMCMVLEMMMFIRAVRTANWKLHLQALEIFVKYFFAHDRYLAEMSELSTRVNFQQAILMFTLNLKMYPCTAFLWHWCRPRPGAHKPLHESKRRLDWDNTQS